MQSLKDWFVLRKKRKKHPPPLSSGENCVTLEAFHPVFKKLQNSRCLRSQSSLRWERKGGPEEGGGDGVGGWEGGKSRGTPEAGAL